MFDFGDDPLADAILGDDPLAAAVSQESKFGKDYAPTPEPDTYRADQWEPPTRPWAAKIRHPELAKPTLPPKITSMKNVERDRVEYTTSDGTTVIRRKPKSPFGQDYPQTPDDWEVASREARYDKGKPLGWMDRALLKSAEVDAMEPADRAKYFLGLNANGLAALHGAPARLLRTAGTTGAKALSLFMPDNAAKDYTESINEGWAGDKTVGATKNPFLKAALLPGESGDPLADATENVSGFAGDTAAFMAGGAASKALPASYLALTKFGQGAGDAAEAGKGWFTRATYAGAEGALGAWQGSIPVGTAAEVALLSSGKRGGQALQMSAALGLAGGDNALYQVMSNGLARQFGVDPDRPLSAGTATAFAQGVGGRAAMGNFGRGGVEEYKAPKIQFERGADGELAAFRPDYFQANSDINLTPKTENDIERNFYMTKSAKLADLGAQAHGLGDWSEILGLKPEPPKPGEFQHKRDASLEQANAEMRAQEVSGNAYRWFELQDALQDHPNSPELKRKLAEIPMDEPTEKAIAVLKMVKAENLNALREVQDFRNQGLLPEDLEGQLSVDQMASERPYYMPRRVIADPNRPMAVPEAGPTMQMQARQLNERTMKAVIDPLTGERFVAHMNDGNAEVYEGGARVARIKPEMENQAVPTFVEGEQAPALQVWKDENGRRYKLGQATREEVEANSPLRYGKDPMAELLNATAQARAVVRGAKTIKAIKDNFTLKDWDKKPDSIPDNYVLLDATAPGGRHFMEPVRKDVAKIIETHMAASKDKGALADTWERVNNTIVNVGFLNPLVHMPNQLDHFIKAQGAMKLFDPTARIGRDLAESMQHIANFTPEYQDYLLAGGNAMRRSKLAGQKREVIQKFLNDPALGKMIESELGQDFPGISGKLHQSLKDLVGVMSDNAVWLPDDAMRFTIYQDALKAGKTKAEAVKALDRAFPDYRNPTNVVDEGKGGNGKAMLNDAYRKLFRADGLTAPLFMKYRFGALRSFLNAWKDLGGTGTDGGLNSKDAWSKRGSALNKILGVVAMNAVVYPALSGVMDAMFGDEEEGLKYKFRAGGHTHIKDQIVAAAKGEKNTLNLLNELFIPNPLVRAGAVGLAGLDPYSGSKIPEGGKGVAMASLVPWLREGLMVSEHGKSVSGSLAPMMMAKRDRSGVEKFLSNRKGMSFGQMNADRYESYKNRVDLMRAYREGDNERAKELEGLMTKEQVENARERFSKPPVQALADKAKSLGPGEIIEAYGKAEADDEKAALAEVLFNKTKKSKNSFRPVDILKAKAIFGKHGLDNPWTETEE